MERRLFLTGMLGVAGAVAFAGIAGPGSAVAGIPQGDGILDELDKPDPAVFEGDDDLEVEKVSHRRWHHRYYGDRYYGERRRRRRGWRRVCRRYWRHGRRHVRCWRERVWLRVWL
ncbi:protamine-2 (modular protein) [Mesorhizobium sp. WSM4307]|uniref:protamine-2 (modular protein) n=1 Tax=unclassified Mesorhizobium TaxID=325217 RepID=UPI000BAF744C|nr:MULTISPECIES: protamine-2 (modular protein) [unclassified Mesorhizobium]PBB27389.1 protamine-2 (modular protein) [Mesorhizobium sp. WSM4304]PBB76992.1 protamine-2 (modular protein) [Mesorhizobium sp. WSM4308]PBC22387.1 protamine-2 (modular protein) [Mesorhizobium sp. WSM4311]TRC73600.1 protamine-2 (modular protein) [Mesorhizobium sp. WSM4315]TRC85003.1 protamine-2 (modular protein) [Mesorhizobium sp. WSM4307]